MSATEKLDQATLAFTNNQVLEALTLYLGVLADDPSSSEAHFGVAACYFQSAKWQQALDASLTMWQLGKQDRNAIYIILHSMLGGANLNDIATLRSVLIKALGCDEFHHIALDISYAALHQQYSESCASLDFACDELVQMVLCAALNTSISFEKKVISTLKRLYQKQELLEKNQEFIESCVCQNILNGGLYSSILTAELTLGCDYNLEKMCNWLLVSPDKITEGINQNKRLIDKISTMTLHQQLELNLAISCNTVKPNSLTPVVADFYNQNAYPRWQHANTADVSLDNLLSSINRSTNNIDSILILGCGTGRQVIELALVYPHIIFTAVDISAASIGYAKYMAKLRQIENVVFFCDDFLTMKVATKYDFVICTGVLHHLASPLSGLTKLNELIKPNGIALLGFYSKIARAQLKPYTQQISELQVSQSCTLQQAIVKWRSQYIKRLDDYLINVEDFYSMTGLSDLLCHPLEHEFNCIELNSLLLATGLEFKTMLLSNYNVQLLREIGVSGDSKDLLYWDRVERISPSFFKNMINFLVVKD